MSADDSNEESGDEGFRGRGGFELFPPDYSRNRNPSQTINGTTYSGHAIDQMQNRGILPALVENAIRTGSQYTAKGQTLGYHDAVNDLRVIVNSDNGIVVTVIFGSP